MNVDDTWLLVLLQIAAPFPLLCLLALGASFWLVPTTRRETRWASSTA